MNHAESVGRLRSVHAEGVGPITQPSTPKAFGRLRSRPRRRRSAGYAASTPKAFGRLRSRPRRRRSPILAQGCCNPGSNKKESLNSEGVHERSVGVRQRLQRCHFACSVSPGLQQPWARIGARLRSDGSGYCLLSLRISSIVRRCCSSFCPASPSLPCAVRR